MQRGVYALIFLAWFGSAFAQSVSVVPTTISPGQLNGPRPSGRFIGTALTAAPQAAAVASANRLMSSPVYINTTSTLATLSFNITTGNASAWNARMCVYADNGAGLPGALVTGSDTGVIAIGSGSVTGVQTSSALNVALPGPGWYWPTFIADSASESVASISSTSGPALSMSLLGFDTIAHLYAPGSTTGAFAAQTFGACPSTYPAASYANNTNVPYVGMGF